MAAKKAVIRLIQVGHAQKPHGLKGEVKAVFYHSLLPKKKLKTIFIGDENPLPSFVEQLRPLGKNLFILKTQDCNDRTQAEELSGNKIHVSKDEFEKYFETEDASGLIGYKAVADGKTLGIIEDVFKLPQQHLAQVMVDGKEVLIPLNEETVVKVDKKKKIVSLDLPEGLLDI